MSLVWIVVTFLVVMWLLGFGFHIGGEFIHLLVVIAIIVALYELLIASRNRTI